MGPKEHKVLDDLGRMDTDGDEVVTLDEMLVFFGACSEVMSDEEFDTIMGDMSDAASTTNGVAKIIAMTESSAKEAGVVGEGEEAEPPPELTAEREALDGCEARPRHHPRSGRRAGGRRRAWGGGRRTHRRRRACCQPRRRCSGRC